MLFYNKLQSSSTAVKLLLIKLVSQYV